MDGSAADDSPVTDAVITFWLHDIRNVYDELVDNIPTTDSEHLDTIIEKFIKRFFKSSLCRNDERLLKMIIIYAGFIGDFDAFWQLEKYWICHKQALFYECKAMIHIARGNLLQANNLYKKGIKRNAQPIQNLKNSYKVFLNNVHEIVREKPHFFEVWRSEQREEQTEGYETNPYLEYVVYRLLQDIELEDLKGYYCPITEEALNNVLAMKSIKLGNTTYIIEHFVGKGGYAKVYKAHIEGNQHKVFALKVEKEYPPLGPWEFYMYRQLDERIKIKRSSFGFAHEFHMHSDCNILVCDYLPLGSLWDVINAYADNGKSMKQPLCMYYTIEMLEMLEVLHDAHLLHGDFKNDNLLIRYPSDELTEEGFRDRTGAWRDQGLCLVDWGTGIDIDRFPPGTVFSGRPPTDMYTCTEAQEGRPWTYQADAYALCVNVYGMVFMDEMVVMEMDLEDREDSRNLPTQTCPEFWERDLWNDLYDSLLNMSSMESDVTILRRLKQSFIDHLCNDPELIRDLIVQLAEGKYFLEKSMEKRRRKGETKK